MFRCATSARSALLVSVRNGLEIHQDVFGRPLVARVDLLDDAVGADDGRAQVVRDVALVVRVLDDVDAELPGSAKRISTRATEEIDLIFGGTLEPDR